MKKSILLCAALAALTACNGNSDNNKSLDYETIDVNFTLKSDLEIPEGTEFGVVALCARDGQPFYKKKYGLVSPSSVSSAVKSLLDKDFITNDKGTYSVYDKFFLLWLSRQNLLVP